MLFSSLLSLAFAATSAATYVPIPHNSTSTSTPTYPYTFTSTTLPSPSAYYPTGTGVWKPSGTGTAAPTQPTSIPPFTGGAAMPTHLARKALGMVVVGGVALML